MSLWITRLLHSILTPPHSDEDTKRRTYLLNVLLVGSIVLTSIGLAFALYNSANLGAVYRGYPPLFVASIIAFFVFLLYLSKKGHSSVASVIFIITYFLPTIYAAFLWGTDLPQVLLGFTLVIFISGILISSQAGFIVTLITGISLAALTYAHTQGIISPESYWRSDSVQVGDIIVIISTLGVIMLISWLSNYEIEKSLRRARSSELALKKERDLLEKKVEERTQELRQTQMDRLLQVYRLADFGRLASGLLHDLANPLNLVSLNLTQLQEKQKDVDYHDLDEVTVLLHRAMIGTQKMESFLQAARKQVQKQDVKTWFSPYEEIQQLIQIFSNKARQLHVEVKFDGSRDVQLFGNPIKFYQLVTNILSNALDAYDQVPTLGDNQKNTHKRQVSIALTKHKKDIVIKIHDWGVGIPKDVKQKIFQPFFTTKSLEKGTGIGLSISKDVIEKDFEGHIDVDSSPEKGTTFTIHIPHSRDV